MEDVLYRLMGQINDHPYDPITAADLKRLSAALEDRSIHAPLPHRTPSLERINHYWRKK